MKKPLWKRWWVWLIAAIIIFSKIGSRDINNTENDLRNNSKSSVETVEPAVESAKSVDECVSEIETMTRTVYENCEFHLSEDQKSLLIYLWQDGLAVEAVKAKKGISPYVEEWEKLINNIKELSMSMQSYMDNNGHPEVITSICVRNDLNLDGIILMIHDGSVILDAVNK